MTVSSDFASDTVTAPADPIVIRRQAAVFLNLLEMFGIDMGAMITVSETLQHFWMMDMAIVFLRKKT